MVDKFTLLVTITTLILYSEAGSYHRTVSYNNEILVRCHKNAPGVKELLQNDYVDIWRVTGDGMVDIRLNKDIAQSASFVTAKVECTKIADVETLVQSAENATRPRKQAEWFEEYHRYDEVVAWYREKCENEHPELCVYIDSIGKSFEGRDQPAILLASNSIPDRPELKIYFQCQIHAREWISGATCMYVANYLLENYRKDDRVTRLLDEMEFIFVPFVNPDGYEYTMTNDRLWRKNRRTPPRGSQCYGVDLNRNYNENWGKEGSSTNPCSETYLGEEVESEPETQNTVNAFRAFAPIIGAIDWHSYGQLIIRPYGDSYADPPDEEQLHSIGEEMARAIYEVQGLIYDNIKGIQLYPTSGAASDWFYNDDATSTNKGYRAAGMTIELRDSGRYGFLLPPDQIIPTGNEVVPAVLKFAELLLNNPLQPRH